VREAVRSLVSLILVAVVSLMDLLAQICASTVILVSYPVLRPISL
jgi:hypothetical protein